MPREAPDWWQHGGGPWPTLLRPAAGLYGWLVARRIARAHPFLAPVPVICIGNFTVGGAGKTPLALAAAAELSELGERPAFLTRGHGGSTRGPHCVSSGQDLASGVGDEALLLARAAPTIVARNRAAGARAAVSANATVIVMDDGFQNPGLAKTLSIIAIDAETGIGNGRVLPAGPLRAPLAFQIGRADALVVVGDGSAAEAAAARMRDLGRPVLAADLVPAGDAGWLSGAPLVAFAGIGRPTKFFATLERLGADVRSRAAFPDHHPFSEADARRLLGEAERLEAQLVTTEKDLVRISASAGPLARLRERCRVLPVTLSMRDRNRFRDLLSSVRQARA